MTSKGRALAQNLTQMNGLNCDGLVKCVEIYEYKGRHYCILEDVSNDMTSISQFKGTNAEKRIALYKVAKTLERLTTSQKCFKLLFR